jgi:V8-like Glu-specific endopeptidase
VKFMAAVLAAVLVAGGVVAGTWSGAATASGSQIIDRQSRVSNVAVAGGDIYVWSLHRSDHDGGGCTVSFAVRSRTTLLDGALTAGHCVATLGGGPSYTVHQTRNGRGNTTDPGDELGVVRAHGYHLGKDGDSALVALDLGRAARAAIFTGGVTSAATIRVAGLARLHNGIHVCYSGAASGEHCGFTVRSGPRAVTFHEGHRTYRIHHEWRATRATCTSRPGDSGSPVYVKRHGWAYAVGILSGGQKASNRCPFFFTPVTLALHRLHAQLLTVR